MGSADTAVVHPRRMGRTPSRSTAGSTFFNFMARLLAWYTLYTVLFQCPTNPTPDSPTICHTSHALKTAVTSNPYYETYVGPYVDDYSPYVREANDKYIAPAWNKVYQSYQTFGQPYVEKGKNYASSEFSRILKPHVNTYQKKGQIVYNEYLSPHVTTANEIWIAVKPKLNVAEKKAENFWQHSIIPAYNRAYPYFVKAYEQGKYLILFVIREGGEKAVGWGRGVWSEVVRPQVGRLGERLGGFGSNTPSAPDTSAAVFESLAKAGAEREAASSSALSSMIASVSSRASESAASASKLGHAATDVPLKLTKKEERQEIESLLESWAHKFETSAEEVLDHLKTQISDIASKTLGDKQKTTVEKDTSSLRDATNERLDQLRKEVNSIVDSLPTEPTSEDKSVAQEKINSAIRRAGENIRDIAQAVRKAAQDFEAKLYDDVSDVTEKSLGGLESTHDFGLQDIGMKWTGMNYVYHKDWKNFHELRTDNQRTRLRIIDSAKNNEELVAAHDWIQKNWLGSATDIARRAAEDIQALRKDTKKLISNKGSSSSFEDYIPFEAVHVGQQVLQKAKAKVVGELKDDTLQDKASRIAEQAKEAVIGTSSSTPVVESFASQISEKIYGTEPSAPETFAAAISEAAESAASAASTATEQVKARVPGGVYAGFVANAEQIVFDEDILDDAKSRLAEASRAVADAVKHAAGYPTATPGYGEQAASRAAELTESALSAASSVLYGTPPAATEQMMSIATDKYSAAVAAASSILYGTPTPTYEAMMSKASDIFAQAQSSAASARDEAYRLATGEKKDKSVQESLVSAAKSNYESAVSVAEASYSSLLAGGEAAKATYESALADANRQLESAKSAASIKVYGTPQPATESLLSVANEKYSSALSSAQASYNDWASEASIKIYGTPTPAYQFVANRASSSLADTASSASLLAADASLSAESAASAASEFLFGPPPPSGITASASSLAADASSSAASAASAASASLQQRYDDLQSLFAELLHGKEPSYTESVISRFNAAVYGTPTPVWRQATNSLSSSYTEATNLAASLPPAVEAVIDDVRIKIRELIYGPEKSQTEKIIAQIRETREAAIRKAKEAVYGPEKGTVEKATSTVVETVMEVTEEMERVFENAKRRIGEAAEEAERRVREWKENVKAQAEDARARVRDEL
ncbi:hypothetical protein EX30DRAFT_398787 [Ascodesmis nigricans]|uniref:Uncharacterized protein n=1 Tax=Ascodesmis nigricans TaxID=341454 RepID=A0A4S2MJF7_9PEZI|nr:hypothetical protein EX30DRAFT_398787 [Ascodesmis nigricans]